MGVKFTCPHCGDVVEFSAPLTPREREVLDYLVRGDSNREIAEAFIISADTVKNHITSILRKLLARNRTDAVRRAIEMGLVKVNINATNVVRSERS